MSRASAKTVDFTPEKQPATDVAREPAVTDIDSTLVKIVAATKLGPLKIMRDYLGLAVGPGRLSFKDYADLRLFDSAFWAGVDRRTVAGHGRNVLINQVVNFRHDWWGMLGNKVATGSYLAAYGFPVVPIMALYGEGLHRGAANVMGTAQELHAFLTDEAHYPIFGKPTEGLQSLGSIGLQRYRPQTNSLETRDGRVIQVDAFIDELRTHYAAGYLFQRFVSPHADIRALCGDRLATVRMVTLTTDSGPKLFRACWKIPAHANMADNFWRAGNLLAKLDLAHGQVQRVLSGTGLNLVEHDRHPDTHASLIGARVPHWQAMIDTVLAAAHLMQHIPLIGWDVTATDEGPVIVELNESPDLFLPQLADGRGVLEPELLDFMAAQKRKEAAFRKTQQSDA